MSRTPLVLVHGNPETAAIWGPLIGALDRADAIVLSPPGFGAGYREWGERLSIRGIRCCQPLASLALETICSIVVARSMSRRVSAFAAWVVSSKLTFR